MKSRQLANVLFKVLGFSICLYAIPSCVSGILFAVTERPPHTPSLDITVMRIITYAIGAGVQFAVGIAIIAMSRKIAGWLFNSEDE